MTDCFIVMPISTLDPLAYSNDAHHFQHVLDHLFIPAVEKAGLNPIPPKAEGADIIHAEIIRNIERADLVLCDMSSLNPNVFFELGIRTAVNKPVCIVKDDMTPNVPFDYSIVNYHTYFSALTPWTLNQQIEALAQHIRKSFERSINQNTMWKYFGLSTRAELPEGNTSSDQRLELLSMQVENLVMKLTENPQRPTPVTRPSDPKVALYQKLLGIAAAAGYAMSGAGWDKNDKMTVYMLNSLPDNKTMDALKIEAMHEGYELSLEVSPEKT